MTAQVGDKLILNDEKHHTVLALNSPIEFSPELFGITPQVACTACWNGVWCDFRLSKDSFIVENLYVNSKDDYSPEINGVNPTLEPQEDSRLLKYMGHHFYKGINYSVPYTGRLLAVSGFLKKYMVYMGPQRLRAYNEVSEWTFEYCALKYQNDFSKAMIASVNHDGDSDSTGAITGNILGALIGYAAIPDCWKKDLEIRDVILEVATDLCRGCQMSEYGTYNDPMWVSKYMQMKAY